MGTLFQVDGTTGNVHTSGSITASGAITSTTGDITLQNQHSIVFQDTEFTPKSVTIHAPTTLTSSYALNWPLLQGASNTFLSNDGSGNLSFTTVSATPAGSNTQVQFNNSGAFGGVNILTYDGTNLTVAPGGSGINLNITSPLSHAGGIGFFDPALTLFTNNSGDVVNLTTASNTGLVLIDGTESQVTINAPSVSYVTASATLELVSTTKGFLTPRMTTTQKTAISSPAEGLIVYDTTAHAPYFWNGSSWIAF